jgi:hypothetical protein
MVAVFAEPRAQFDDFERSDVRDVPFVLTEASDGSRDASSNGGPVWDVSSVRSALLPASMVIRCGLARAFASFRNVDKPLNAALEETS